VRTQSSFRSDSKDDDDEEEDQEGDDEASSSTSSDDDEEEPEKSTLPSVKVQPPTPAASSSISGLKNLTKILQKFSVPDESPTFPSQNRFNSSGIIKKSFSSHQIRSTTTPPAFLGGLSSNDLGGLSRTKSSSGFGCIPPPSSLTLTGLRSSSDNISSAIPPPPSSAGSHYVEAPGPTLVGLVARNVMSSAMSTAGSSSNSIASSALNYSAANLKPANGPSDLSPTSLLMKSVSSTRIVSEAKQHLERPKSLVLNSTTTSTSTTHSLIPPENSPGLVRRNASVGTKQYEASLSPDSAEKKQREILQFFGSSSTSFPAVSPLPAVAPPVATPKTMVNHHAAARSVLRQFSLDNNSGSSDVDELFNQLLADQILSPEASVGHHRFGLENPLSVESSLGGGRDKQTSRNKFADRRKAWEDSTCTSITLHSSLMSSDGNMSSRESRPTSPRSASPNVSR
jgi:hypothetical protein